MRRRHQPVGIAGHASELLSGGQGTSTVILARGPLRLPIHCVLPCPCSRLVRPASRLAVAPAGLLARGPVVAAPLDNGTLRVYEATPAAGALNGPLASMRIQGRPALILPELGEEGEGRGRGGWGRPMVAAASGLLQPADNECFLCPSLLTRLSRPILSAAPAQPGSLLRSRLHH